MEISVLTIRDKKTKEIIYAEGTPHDEAYPNFKLDKKYLTQSEWDTLEDRGAWRKRGNYCVFNEEMRHLRHDQFELIEFNTDETYVFDSPNTLVRSY